MKDRLFIGAIAVAFLFLAAVSTSTAEITCTTIKDGTLVDVVGNPITFGYDQFGYNYQAHIFNGRYCDNDRIIGGDDCDVWQIMKWNDPLLSNEDCSGDNLLDRHYGFPGYIGSGAWLTDHRWSSYEMDGETCYWDHFVKMVAPPADAYRSGGFWYAADGTEIGPIAFWVFAIIEEVYNDPCAGLEGISYNSPLPTGFGYYQ